MGRVSAQTITVTDLLNDLRTQLTDAGIEHPDADAELIIGHVLGESRGRVQALAFMGAEISAADREAVHGLADERARRVPLQHLTGRAPFRGIELAVGPGVFVPRPETEIVAQYAIDALQLAPDPQPLAIDLCTGSGAIALALAQEVPTARIWAVENSREAHAWATRNVAALGDARVCLLQGDITELDPARAGGGVQGGGDVDEPAWVSELRELRGWVHVLVSNPPYVPDGMVPRDPEVRDHDPEVALFGGSDGLDLVRVISRIGLDWVRPGGALVLEHAETQGAAIRSLLRADGWRATATHPDLTMRDRATTAVR